MQRGLIKQGKWADAAEMDVKDIKKKFGNKYDSGIKKTLDKAEFDGLISKANKTKIKKKCGGK